MNRIPLPVRQKHMSYPIPYFSHVYLESEFVSQLCLTLVRLHRCSPLGSSVHGISQARTWEWVATSFSRGSSQPRDRTQVSCIKVRFFTIWATRETLNLSLLLSWVLLILTEPIKSSFFWYNFAVANVTKHSKGHTHKTPRRVEVNGYKRGNFCILSDSFFMTTDISWSYFLTEEFQLNVW